MRRLRFLPALLMILSACSESIIEQNPSGSDKMGSVSISLSADMRDENIVSKAGAEEPVLNDFRVAIYKVETKMRLYNDSYANTVGKEIKLNEGDYRLVAQHGDSLGCGFNKPYYMADPTFTIKERNTQVKAVAKLSNVRLAVKYDATIADAYPDYYTIVRHKKYSGKTVKFAKGETRYGYIPGGELILEVWALVDGVWKTYQTAPATYAPNDFVTFTITTNASEGNLVINIKVDNTVEDKNETIEIPATTVPQDAPSITLSGFDGSGNVHEFVEGVSAGANAMASFVARGSIAKAVLSIDSEYLAGKGIPTEVDFADLSTNDKTILKSAGFAWDESMATSRNLSYIDFSDVISKMLANIRSASEDVKVADFTLSVEDAVGKKATASFSIVSGSVKPSVSIEDYNVWATKVVSPVVTINKGNVNLVKLQVSADGKIWNDINDTPVQEGYALTYGTITAAPSTTYYVRAVYNGNDACVSPVLTIRTEDAAQVGNSGFEDWTVATHTYEKKLVISYGNSTRDWYLPWVNSSEAWWAVNSKKTMPDETTPEAQPYKVCPTVSFSTKDFAEGKRSAQIATVLVSSGATKNTLADNSTWKYTVAAGELFIGSSDVNGNHSSDGHAFASRPSELKFKYKYDSYDGETYYAYIEVRNASGNVIASKLITDGSKSDSWKECSMVLDYKDRTSKAASIFISFKSTSSSSPSYETDVALEMNGGEQRGHMGSVLKVDDLKLLYY